MSKYRLEVIDRLQRCGISYDDAVQLRKISMVLHRWHEMECGTDAGCIERDEKTGVPYLTWERGMKQPRGRAKYPDKEKGALKRLKEVMDRYATVGLGYYIQGDPRGASLYILRPGDVPAGEQADAYYNRGVAVYK